VDAEFIDGGICGVGSCQVVDGQNDYCPECAEPGQEACGLSSRVVCDETRRFEAVETCPNGCTFDGGATRCL
jgi:hypothetical protein